MSPQKPVQHTNLSQTTDKPESVLSLYLRLPDEQRRSRFVDTHTLAHKYGISQRTVQRLIDRGELEAVRVGGKYQVDLRSFVRYLKTCEQ